MNRLLISVLIVLISGSCGTYSFTGASISPDTKTISIPLFYNNASLGPATMSADFTERIREYYQTNTSLTLVDENGDLQLEGEITNYTLTPEAPTASDRDDGIDYSGLTKITITVNVSYTNVNDDSFDFLNKKFSFFRIFDQNTEELSTNEQDFVDEIFERIVLDIFNATVANW